MPAERSLIHEDLPVDVIRRVDQLADDGETTRNSVLEAAIRIGLCQLERDARLSALFDEAEDAEETLS